MTLQSAAAIREYAGKSLLVKYERELIAALLPAIDNGDSETVAWFAGFGNSLSAILMNVHGYRKRPEFGFTEISFDKYGWFESPVFFDYEVIKLGNTARYGEYSEIRIGKGPNWVWSFALSYSFGCAGGGSALSVYDPHFNSRDAALNTALGKLKKLMTAKISDQDIANFKQDVISKTLKAISQYEIDMVQLSLF